MEYNFLVPTGNASGVDGSFGSGSGGTNNAGWNDVANRVLSVYENLTLAKIRNANPLPNSFSSSNPQAEVKIGSAESSNNPMGGAQRVLTGMPSWIWYAVAGVIAVLILKSLARS